MTVVFVVSAAIVFYAYLGYPLLLACIPNRPVKTHHETPLPAVSVLLCVHNAQDQVRQKLDNLSSLDYPDDLLRIIVVCDGCTDRTVEIGRGYRDDVPIQVVECPQHLGKAAALNQAVQAASGDILFMVDVRQRIEPSALKSLVRHFADPTVGAVSGELVFVDEGDASKPVGVGVYWKFEKLVRKMESHTGSVMGATGAVYAVRRELVPQLPDSLILDDVFIPMHVVKAGKRVLFDSRAIATDRIASDHRTEFSRKVRTLYGNLQLVEAAPWLLGPRNPAWLRFVSHKLLRIVVPVPLALLLISSFASRWAPLHAFFWLQLVIYGMAAIAPLVGGPALLVRLLSVARTFALLNAASAVALFRFLARRPVVWNVTKIKASETAAEDEVVHA